VTDESQMTIQAFFQLLALCAKWVPAW